ncbi:MAG: hypothetical protein INQ03_24990 [Candidatus Heimdallarchaeota archaeon]|nr:hypothetical protein [Candidatus Heimdallarchaeota archaeon]
MAEELCPHCGKPVHEAPKYNYAFKPWATPMYILLISIMIFVIDFVHNQIIAFSYWAILGIWLLYIPVQLLRANPRQGWIIVPLGGLMLSFFLVIMDKQYGDNSGTFGLDWAPLALAFVITFMVFFPIVARLARDAPSEIDRLRLFIEHLEEE